MKPSLQKLQKFLKLEADRGYDNHAVLGGLERMLGPWESEARVDQMPEEFIQAVVSRLRDYQRLSAKSRAEALQGLWRRIQREANSNLPPLPAVSPEANEDALSPAEPIVKVDARPAPEHKVEAPPLPAQIDRENNEPLEPETDVSIDDLLSIENSPASIETIQTVNEQKSVEPDVLEPGMPAELDATRRNNPEVSLPQPAPPIDIQKTGPADRPVTSSRPSPDGSPPAALNAPITVLPGVGARHGQTLSRLGLKTLGDMLYYFPRRYDDYSKLLPINRLFYGQEVTVIATVQSIAARPIRGGHSQIIEAVVSDGTGSLRINWFNQIYIAKRMRAGMQVVLSGKIDQYLGRLVMNSPEWEPIEQQNLHTNRIVPVYPLTASITQRWLRRIMYQVVSYWGRG